MKIKKKNKKEFWGLFFNYFCSIILMVCSYASLLFAWELYIIDGYKEPKFIMIIFMSVLFCIVSSSYYTEMSGELDNYGTNK